MATIRIEGLRELEKNLERLTKAAGRGVLRRSLQKAAEPLAEKARALAPVGEGDLQDSIAVGSKLSKRQARLHRKTVRDDQASVEMFVGAGPLPQAHLTEFGSIHGAPQAYMRPAWDADQRQLLDRLAKTLWVEVEKSISRAERKAARLAAKG